MPLKKRLYIAIPMLVAFILIDLVIYFPLLALGVMGTDGCGSVDFGVWGYWLTLAWPVFLLLGAIIAPALVAVGTRWYWALAGWVVGVLLGAGGFIAWLFIIQRFCGGSVF